MSSAPPKAANAASNGASAPYSATSANGRATGKKKQPDTPIDPVTMYESVRSRIAALEEEEGIEEEEDNRMGQFCVAVALNSTHIMVFSDVSS